MNKSQATRRKAPGARTKSQGPRIKAKSSRTFALGSAVVSPTDVAFGREAEFSPAEYGNYIATSNAVYACATMREMLLRRLPLRAYKLKANGDKAEISTGQLVTLLQKVNPFWTFKRLIGMTELSLCLWGKCFWFLERGESSRLPPREIWWGRPDRVKIVPDPVNYIKAFLYTPLNASVPIPFEPSEVIWLRFSNPLDEYDGLAPMAAARLAADYRTDAMQSNRNLFKNGIQSGGAVVPKAGTTLTDLQAQEIEKVLEKKYQGVSKAHRWAVFRFEAEMKALGFNPKEAEFIAGMGVGLEDVARAFHMPLDLIGGQRTYENVDAAMLAVWEHCILPEADFISSELVEQLVPMFPNEADLLEFDASGVAVLQKAKAERWNREKDQMDRGALTINDWLKEQGRQPYPWGNVWWASFSLTPVRSDQPEEPAQENPKSQEPNPKEEEKQGHKAQGARRKGRGRRDIAYGSEEHRRIWRQFDERAQKNELLFGKRVAEMFRRQRESVIAKLKDQEGGRHTAHGSRGIEDNPFDKAEWIRKFRVETRPLYRQMVQEAGDAALEEIGLAAAFNVGATAAARFIEQRVQRFATEVNATTWDMLKESLSAGLEGGEGLPKLIDRVEAVMGDRIASSGETIARTETIGALNGGKLEAWRQSEVVVGKTWLASLDDRTRETHAAAHGQTVKLDEDFDVGGCSGQAPGQTGCAEEDIDCRCTMTAEVED